MLDLAFGGLDEQGESIISPDEEEQSDQVIYGDLVLSIAPKEDKANTLLASALFSPSFFLAERIEMGQFWPVAGKTVLELGAGAALPSLLLSTLPKDQAASLIVTTDYPDEVILGNVRKNVERNAKFTRSKIIVEGYRWGDDPTHVLKHLNSKSQNLRSGFREPSPKSREFHLETVLALIAELKPFIPIEVTSTDDDASGGFDILVLSDLLHFDQSHSEIIASVGFMLKKSSEARVYVVAGKYTRREICESFLEQARREAGLVWKEFEYRDNGVDDDDDGVPNWRGVLGICVGGIRLTDEELVARRENCWGWVGRNIDNI